MYSSINDVTHFRSRVPIVMDFLYVRQSSIGTRLEKFKFFIAAVVSTANGEQRIIRQYTGAAQYGGTERDFGGVRISRLNLSLYFYSLSCIRCTHQRGDAFSFPRPYCYGFFIRTLK